MSNSETLLSNLVIFLLTVFLLGLVMKRFNQPYFVAYIVAGIVLGPFGFSIFNSPDTIATVGELGLIIQMFFIGTRLEIQHFATNLRKPLIGVLAQILLSYLFMSVIGLLYQWSLKETLLFTFIISLSSSAIILDYLEKNNEISQPLGLLSTAILVLQDFLLVPMLLTINFLGDKKLTAATIISLLASLIFISFLLTKIIRKRRITVPLPQTLQNDHELQVFVALLFCFGFAWASQSINLSSGTGALIAGIVIGQAHSMQWLDGHLTPFRIFFLSLFFVAIGLQINVAFFTSHLPLVLLVVAAILVINSVINAIVFRILKESWRNSIYAGALLSQIGEFSLVLCMVARAQHMVSEFWYQLTLAVVSTTMLLTAIWINIIRKFIYIKNVHS